MNELSVGKFAGAALPASLAGFNAVPMVLVVAVFVVVVIVHPSRPRHKGEGRERGEVSLWLSALQNSRWWFLRRRRATEHDVNTAGVRKRGARRSQDLGLLVTEVATRLRCGETVEYAWRKALVQHGFVRADGGEVLRSDGIPHCLWELWQLTPLVRKMRRIDRAVVDALPATFAVCRLASQTGAPMADILDSCALSITEASEAKAAREVALAGPVASVRLLAVLPIFGLLVGVALGARPIEFLTSTFVGHLCLALGVTAECCGIAYVQVLKRRARMPSSHV